MNRDRSCKVLEQFRDTTDTLVNPELREWKRHGGKVIGYFSSYVPEEIIAAAGILPFHVRATGSSGMEQADYCLRPVNCDYVRHCLSTALRGEQSFLDGIVSFNSCDSGRRLYDNWQHEVEIPYTYFLDVPKKVGDAQVVRYQSILTGFKRSLEEHFQVEITDQSLWESIKLHNEARHLQRKLYELRKSERPPLTGAEVLATMVAGTAMPKERYVALLKDLLDDCDSLSVPGDYSARIMLVGGGELDDPQYVEVIEGMGGLVVADSLDFGSRLCWNEVDESGDPLAALARYYLTTRVAGARTFGTGSMRLEHVKTMAREFDVDGVISLRLVSCDQWGFEQRNLSVLLKNEHLPHLQLDREYILGGTGQLKTRVQAFLETVTEAAHEHSN